MKRFHPHDRRMVKPFALVTVIIMVLALCQAPVYALGGDLSSLESIVAVGQDGRLAVTEFANVPAPGASIDFFVPSLNYSAQSRAPTGKEPIQGAVTIQRAASGSDERETVYTLSSKPGQDTYTVTTDKDGSYVSLYPSAQAAREDAYILTYLRDGAVTRYQDVAELDLVLANSGEYGAISTGTVYIMFPNAVNFSELNVFVHGARRWEYGAGKENNLLGITCYGVDAGGILEVRILMPVSYVPSCSNTVQANARQAVLDQENLFGDLPMQPDPLQAWKTPLIVFGIWLFLVIALLVIYRFAFFSGKAGEVTAPPSELPPALASRLLSPMGMDPCVLLSVFLHLVRQGILSLAFVENEKGKKAFRFSPTGKTSIFAMKHEKALLDWISADVGYDGVTDLELKSAGIRRPGRYYRASSDVLLHAINDATDCGLLRDTPAWYRLLWVVLALGLAVGSIVFLFLGHLEPLILLLPAAFTLVFRLYTRKVPSERSLQESARWRAYAAGLASYAVPIDGELDSVENGFVYSVALGASDGHTRKLEELRLPQMQDSPVLAPFMADGKFSARLYKRLLSSFRSAAFFSAAFRSSLIRSARKETYATRIKKK